MKSILKYYLLAILAVLFLPVNAVFASDISNAKWLGLVTVTNNSTAASNIATVFSLNTTSMINQSFSNDNLTDVAMVNTADDYFMPGYGSNPWCLFVPNIGTSAHVNFDIYAKDATSTSLVYFPGNGGMTVADNSTLEWGASGNISIDAMFNPASTEPILEKAGALYILPDGSGDVLAYADNGTSTTSTFRPNAAGDLTGLTPSAGANYACAGDNNDTTTVYTTSATYLGDLYNFPNHTSESGPISSLTVYMRIKSGDGSAAYAMPQWKIGGVSYNGTEQSTASTSLNNKTQTYTISPATGTAWTWAELDGAQFGVWLKRTTTSTFASDVWYVVNQPTVSLTISGISTAEHTFKLGLSGGTLSFQVDAGSANTTAMSGNITNNGNAWQIGDDDSTLYIANVMMGVGASVVTSLAWEYGAIFHDSIGDNDATPTFRTTSSDANISAAVSSFQPTSQAEASVSSTAANLTVINDPTAPSQLYTEGDFSYIPGGVVVNALLDASGTPRALWWYPFLFLGIALIGMMLYGATSGTVSMGSAASAHMGSLLLQSIVCEVFMVVFAVMGAIPLFPAFVFPVGAVAVILSVKHYGWG